MTFGGEPLLYPEVVCKIHKAAEEMGIPERTIITNSEKVYPDGNVLNGNVYQDDINKILDTYSID